MAYVQVKQREIYEADDQQKKKDQTISVASVLKTIGVSRSGFYSYKKNENLPTQTQIRNEHLQKEIKNIHKESYGIYGSPKITVLLNKNGENVSQKHVYNLMHVMGIKARYARHYKKNCK